MADKVEIKIKVKDEDVSDFLSYFLESTPNTSAESDFDWPQEYVKSHLLKRCKMGAESLAVKNVNISDIEIEEIT